MPHAIRVQAFGGPEVMKWEEVQLGEPGPGQVRIKQHAAGVNYLDVYHRTGLYPIAAMPFTPGSEGAGQVVAVGEGVTDLAVGDRVAYAGPMGGYAEERLHSCGQAGEAARRYLLRDRGGHDAAGHDRALSREGDFSGYQG